MTESIRIERLNTQRANELKTELVNLLQNTVDHGASVGFLRPLKSELADQFWSHVISGINTYRILLVAFEGNHVIGTVQAELCPKQNGRHRAEVQKLMVLTSHRQRGVARVLMDSIERATRDAGCSLLFLDTVTGKPAEQVYKQLGWTLSGTIPNYAVSPDGEMESTTIFYKLLDDQSQLAA
ncbi:MAG TPA: GNAT family N-acetyltransferase [Steroidobacteraceae bacterium]|jgi:GNAT superfamily N-acetyltransferase|nr:GNAT family N-acetyltransferase [Steroidobacteraceae bacterium]